MIPLGRVLISPEDRCTKAGARPAGRTDKDKEANLWILRIWNIRLWRKPLLSKGSWWFGVSNPVYRLGLNHPWLLRAVVRPIGFGATLTFANGPSLPVDLLDYCVRGGKPVPIERRRS